MRGSPPHTRRAPSLVLAGAVAALASGCSDEGARAPRADDASATAPLLFGAPSDEPVDRYGNLRPTDRRVLGFPIPRLSERIGEGPLGPSIQVTADRRRLQRFYRSRGFALSDTPDGWEVRHTERTRRSLEDPGERVTEATLYATRRSGPGWMLRFEPGEPVQLDGSALLEKLHRRARGEEPATGKDGEGRSASPAPAGGGTSDDAAPGDEPADASGSEPPSSAERAGEGRSGTPPRSRDVRPRIREYLREHPNRRYLD